MKNALIFAMIAVMAGTATPGSTQTAGPACKSGNYSVIRTSRIKPGGSMAGFAKAVADNAKWYPDHGYKADRVRWASVMALDGTGKPGLSPDLVMTFHTDASDTPPSAHDAAWAAFVAEYNANTDIVSTTMACMQP